MALDNKHPDFTVFQAMMNELCGWECCNIQQELESKEYGACSFDMNNHHILFRVGKITPTKIGQFVTFWKRIGNGPIMPYDVADPFDFFVIAARYKEHCGLFIFSKDVLYAKVIISKNGKGGKRALRIYPVWDVADNAQAKKTQAWQLQYFYEIRPHRSVDKNVFLKLFA
ncbi:MAG TPA: MepB family protein [Candidatus Babeliales bacterium]|jgi:hypothetical protein|nr:MepB family protein [Candidatus Babeliales bacterium]